MDEEEEAEEINEADNDDYSLREFLNDENDVRDGLNVEYRRKNAVGVFEFSQYISDQILRELRAVNRWTFTLIYRITDLTLLVTTIALSISYFNSSSIFYFHLTLYFFLAPSIFFTLLYFLRILFSFRAFSNQTRSLPIRHALLQIFCFAVFPTIGAYQRWRNERRQWREGVDLNAEMKHKLTTETIRLTDEICILYLASNFFQGLIQFLLQFFIKIKLNQHNMATASTQIVPLQLAILISSLLSLVLSCVGFQDSLLRMRWTRGFVITLLWKSFSIAARLLILCLCLTISWQLFLSFCFAHFIFALLAINIKVLDGGSRIKKFLTSLPLSVIHIVDDLNLNYKRGFPHRLIFYTCSLVEGIIVVSIWTTHTDQYSVWWHYWFAIIVYVLFFIGLFFARFRHEYEYSAYYFASNRHLAAHGRVKVYVFNCCLGYPEYY